MPNTHFILCFIFLSFTTAFSQSMEQLTSDFGRMYLLSGEVIEEYQNLYDLSEERWYQNIKNSTVRFNGGCTASFVSDNGLLITAAHCTPFIELQNHDIRASVFNKGYLAKSSKEELKANSLTVSQLVHSIDVTEELHSVSKDDISESHTNFLKGEYAQKTEFKGLTLEIKRYFNDKKIVLNAYKDYNDVRLVFVPNAKVRNNEINSSDDCVPSYDFDVSFWRVYDNGVPLNTYLSHLTMNQFNTKKEEAVFVAGFPGETNRYKSPAELEYLAKHNLRYKSESLKDQIALLTESISANNDVNESDYVGQMCRIRSINALNSVTNIANQTQFVFEKLSDPKSINRINDLANKLEFHDDFFKINKELKTNYSQLEYDAWAMTHLSPSPRSTSWEVLFMHRLEKYRRAIDAGESESKIISLMQDAFSIGQSFGKNKSILTIKGWLQSIQDNIHPEDSFMEEILQRKTIEEYINHLFTNSGFGSYDISKATMENRELINSDINPIVVLSNKISTRYLEAKEQYELKKPTIDSLNSEVVDIIYKTLGKTMIPNADATLRLSDGNIMGYSYCGFENMNTTFNSITLSDATSEKDLMLLAKLPRDYKKRIAFISSTNDGTGGNSGSPLINIEGEFIGLVFKKGKHSEYPNEYIYDPKNLSISIHAQAIYLCMKYIYQADDLMKEILR